MKHTLVWFRNDLRTHDHLALSEAMKHSDRVIACYILDKAIYDKKQYGFNKIGPFRLKFLLDGLEDLKRSLAAINVPLFVFFDTPVKALKRLNNMVEIDTIYYHQLVGHEEETTEASIQNTFEQIKFKSFFNKTLIHPEDLPFDLKDLPELFTTFRQNVEKDLEIKPLIDCPNPQTPLDIEPVVDFDCLQDFGYNDCIKPRFKGGEREGLKRLNYYFFESKAVSNYKETRNYMLFDDDSSKFSPYLSQGALSPRQIYYALIDYESTVEKNESTYWLFFELLWRDFFTFTHMKHKNKLFDVKGIKNIQCSWKENQGFIDKFIQGKTGYPLVDANMKELQQTGYMSNRGRQNVASFFTKNLGLNWLIGAAFFEMMLIDYDVSSNYANWAYIAGVGNDNLPFRFFNVEKQGELYDKEATYAKKYLPNLKNLPNHLVYKIHRLNQLDLVPYNIILGKDYPKRMVDFEHSINDRKAEILKANPLKK